VFRSVLIPANKRV